MYVSPETFRLHMSLLRDYFQPIHLSHWLELKNTGKELPLRACAITFDDGWADNYEFAFPVLKEFDIPATIFLVSEMIGKNQTFWPERLARLLINIAEHHSESWAQPSLDWIKNCSTSYTFSAALPTQDELSEIIDAAKSFSDEEINHRLDTLETTIIHASDDVLPSLLSWQQVNEMCNSGLVEAGSHTCHHIRLTDNIDNSRLTHEIISSKKTIEDNIGHEVKTFCYPNGNHSEHALSLVRQHYIGAVTTQSGWNTSVSDNHLLNRIGVHEDISNDRTSFLSRLSGWL